jgi:hypothetical protein
VGDWYIVIKTIKGHRYRYRQRTWREGKHVRTESQYLGAEGGSGAGHGAANPTGGGLNKVASERELIDRIFDNASLIGSLQFPRKPWAGRYSTKANFTPVVGLLDLPRAMKLAAVSRPWAGPASAQRKGLNQDGAWYAPGRDRLQIPDHTRFASASEFARVLLHELAHATGHATRLGRENRPWHMDEYAREEMVADLTAHLVAFRLGLPGVPVGEAARYVQMYLKQCDFPDAGREYAEREALRAADYLLKRYEAARVNTTVGAH